jgi:hypothetical protein
MKNTYYIGLDVHKETIAIAYASGAGREDGTYHGQCGGSIPAAVNALRRLADKLGVGFRDLKVCYEAGPTGFVLARRLIRYGLHCVLMSPSKTERKPNDKIKTDSRAERDRQSTGLPEGWRRGPPSTATLARSLNSSATVTFDAPTRSYPYGARRVRSCPSRSARFRSADPAGSR